MTTSAQTKESREQKERTLDTIDASPLTSQEKQSLSRETVISWYKAQSLEKLKALQDEIVKATPSERQELKEKIIVNTKKELEDHKELTAVEKEKQATNFAEDLMKIDERSTEKNIESVARTHNETMLAQNVFFKTLDEYTGTEKNGKHLKRLTENGLIKRTLILIKEGDKNLAQEIDIKIREGDYEGMKDLIVKATKGKMSKKNIDQLFGFACFEKMGQKELTGVKSIDGILNSLGAYKYLGHTYAMKKAAEDSDAPYYLVLRTSTMTVKDISAMDNNLQRFKHIVEGKENKSMHDVQQLEFIKAINNIRTKTDQKVAAEGLEHNFLNILDKYLAKKIKEKKMDEARAMQIRARAKIEDLRLIQIYDLTYGKPEDRDRALFHTFSRIPTMVRFWKRNMGEGRELNQALYEYHKKRVFDHDSWDFKRNAKKWGLGAVMGDMNKLEGAINGNRGKVGELFSDAERFKMSEDLSKVTSGELYEHDLITKKYHYLVSQTSEIMTKQAKDVLKIGGELEQYQKLIAQDPNATIGKISLSNEAKKILFPGLGIAAINAKPAKELITAYGEKLVDMRTMHDVTRARFMALAETIEQKVAGPFGEKLEGKIEVIKGKKERVKMQESIDDIKKQLTPTGKLRKLATYGALPAFLLGMEVHGLTTGKVKPREVPWDIIEAGSGFIPVVGTLIDFRAAISGTSLSGKKLSFKEQMVAAGFGVVGAIADVGTLFGGAGLYLRGAIGGARAARRSVAVGREMKTLAQAAHAGETADKASILHRIGMGAASKFDKTKDFDSALAAGVKARAQEQVHYMAKCGLKETDDINSVKKAINEAEAAGDTAKAADLRKVEKLMEETNGGVGYLKIFNDRIGTMTVPNSWFSKTSFGTWLREMKLPRKEELYTNLRKLKFTDEEIENFVRNFDKIKDLQGRREAAVHDLAKLTSVKEGKMAELNRIQEGLKANANKHQSEFLSVLEKERTIAKEKAVFAQDASKLKEKYKDNKEMLELIEKANKGEKIDAAKLTQVDKKDIEMLEKFSKSNEEFAKIGASKTKLNEELTKTNKDWLDKVNKNHGELKAVEGEFETANAGLRNINTELGTVNQAYFRFESEMMMRGEQLVKWGERTRTAARYLQYGGLVSGGAWLLLDKDPIEQAKFAAQAAGTGMEYGGKVADELLFTDHSGSPALDVMIEEQAKGLERKAKYQDMLDKVGKSVDEQFAVASTHMSDPEMEGVLREKGLLEKFKEKLKQGAGAVKDTAEKVAGKTEIAASDAARKLREKI